MPRARVWVQLLIGWLPVGVLFATLIRVAHGTAVVTAALIALRMMVAAAILGLAVERLTRRLPWPRPFRLRFLAIHLAGAALYSTSWIVLNSVIESVVRRQPVVVAGGAGLEGFVVLGIWLYVMVAGVAYATRATERAAEAEAHAARAQLAALRNQLNPHFLFNALHTVVQLIPRQPERAVAATEQIAALLRSTLDAEGDVVPLREELAFVARYLALERLRFGDRLSIEERVAPELDDLLVPSFAVLTLVENAVRHGAGPRVEPTAVSIEARRDADLLVVTVSDDGAGADTDGTGRGTGLRRLRDRLAALDGGRGRLEIATAPGRGFTATLSVPVAAE
jgi:two-component sensor histidine kinase